MIVDSIDRLEQYAGVHPRFSQVVAFLKENEAGKLEPGKYEIDGAHVFALVQEYETKSKEQSIWEAHRKYIDIQYVVEGVEALGHIPISQAEAAAEYDAERDFALFKADGYYMTLRGGYFAVFAPQDVHMPGVAAGAPSAVKKIVFKVEV